MLSKRHAMTIVYSCHKRAYTVHLEIIYNLIAYNIYMILYWLILKSKINECINTYRFC